MTDSRRFSDVTGTLAILEVHSRYAYDGAARLTSITHARTDIAAGQAWNGTVTLPASITPTSTIAAYAFAYDRDNRMTSMRSYADRFTTSFIHDPADQLTAATSVAIVGLAAPAAESYNLDANGNRNTSAGGSQSALGTHNRLQTDGTVNYGYDLEGNLTLKTKISDGTVTQYIWDHRDRLARVWERVAVNGTITKQTTYEYDAFDRRVMDVYDSNGDGVADQIDRWFNDGTNRLLQIRDSDGVGAAQGFRISNRYLHGNDTDRVIADEQFASGTGPTYQSTTASALTGTTLWSVADHLGSARDLVDNNGIVRKHVVYDSFGKRLAEVNRDAAGVVLPALSAAAVDSAFGYTGADWDADVNLTNHDARWYDANTGRWLSQDPIGFAADDANLYRYVGNGPTTKTDPSGLVEIGIEVSTFIPSPSESLGPGIELEGEGRDVSPIPGKDFKIKSRLRIETEAFCSDNPLLENTSAIGQSTLKLEFQSPGIGDFSVGTTFTATGKMYPAEPNVQRNGGTTKFTIGNSGRVPRTFVVTAIAPYIDFSIDGVAERMQNGQVRLTLTYRHDGFPAYELYVNQGLEYCHDPRVSSQTPLSLFGGGEFRGTIVLYLDGDTGEVLRDATSN